jgi:uncharacterized FAD-dependent dehydrogenase
MREVTVQIAIPPEHCDDAVYIRKQALLKAGIHDDPELRAEVLRRSIDARKKQPRYVLKVRLTRDTGNHLKPDRTVYPDVSDRPLVHIIGAGPAGYFAALMLIRHHLKPVILERGKDVQQRRRDLRAIQQSGIVNPDSNYCFGEGGAGTYSDGKLYTRATKRGDVSSILDTLVEHGANPDILVDAHPHVGSNKLPGVVEALRHTVINAGGEIRFDARLTDLNVRDEHVHSLTINDEETIPTQCVILATGHSARDIYSLLHGKGIAIEFKPFALGVRVEHPQELIDRIQYGQPRSKWLPAAAYRLTCQVDARGVFSFCMCPGGLIVPSATSPGEIVINGMSLSRRDSPYANSGMVASISSEDVHAFQGHGALAGVAFQQKVEQACFHAGDGSQRAPAQRLTDFIRGVPSSDLPATSYIPGVFPYPLEEVLPPIVTASLRQGFRLFGTRVPGYVTSEAILVATESRTSAPVRVPRDQRTWMHPQISGLFPCGEGAGYAGGIVSAAIDGQNVAKAVAAMLSVDEYKEVRIP